MLYCHIGTFFYVAVVRISGKRLKRTDAPKEEHHDGVNVLLPTGLAPAANQLVYQPDGKKPAGIDQKGEVKNETDGSDDIQAGAQIRNAHIDFGFRGYGMKIGFFVLSVAESAEKSSRRHFPKISLPTSFRGLPANKIPKTPAPARRRRSDTSGSYANSESTSISATHKGGR